MNYDDLYIPTDINFINIAIGTDDYIQSNMTNNESMLVHRKGDKHSLIVGQHGVSINTTRSQAASASNVSIPLYVDGDIYTTGTIFANHLSMYGITLSDEIDSNVLTKLIHSINSNTLPIHEGYDSDDRTRFNIYSTSYLTIGNLMDTVNNLHPLNIVESASGKVDRLQLNIRNETKKRFSIGILGNSDSSPAMLFTEELRPLHFHVSQNASLLTNTYDVFGMYDCNTMPQLAIDTNKSVVINNTNSKQITYNKYGTGLIITSNIINTFPKLYVDGTAYIADIITKDSYSGSNKHLDDVYIRKEGYTIEANQIIPGAFNPSSEYTFQNGLIVQSMLQIEELNATKLVTITGELLAESNVIIEGVLELRNELIAGLKSKFMSGIEVSEDLILSHGSFVYDGTRLNLNNIMINRNEYNYSVDKIEKYFDNTNDIDSNSLSQQLSNHLINHGTSNIYSIFNYIDDDISAKILIKILADYSTLSSTSNTASVFTLARDDMVNIDNSNVFIPGQLGVGMSSYDTSGHLFKIIKRQKHIDKHQILLEYIKRPNSDIYNAFIGHTSDPLNSNFNGFSIITNNVTGHNIEFYAGIDKTLINNIKPNLIITTNNRIGINTDKPSHTLDINGNIRYNNAYKTLQQKDYKVIHFLEIENKIFLENSGNKNIGLNIDKKFVTKALNVGGGINSIDGFYEGNSKLEIFKEIDSKSVYLNKNISIGWSTNTFNANTTLQLRNLSREENNETLIRLYRGIQDGINNANFTGLEFCPYAIGSAINKWYIYNNHLHDSFDIGYCNSGNNKNAINIVRKNNEKYHVTINGESFDTNTEPNTVLTIKGDVIIEGNINVIGPHNKYLLHGNELLSNSVSIDTSPPLNSFSNLTLSDKDILIRGKKIILIPSISSTLFIGDNTNYFMQYMTEYATNDNVKRQSGNLLVFQDTCFQGNLIADYKPCATFTTANGDTTNITLVRIGILQNTQTSTPGLTYSCKLDLLLKEISNGTIFETKINDSSVSSIYKKNNRDVQIKYGDNNSTIVDTTYLHIENNGFQDLLQLTNNTLTPSIILNNQNKYWRLSGPSQITSNFEISYHTGTGLVNTINNEHISTPFVINSEGRIGINKVDNIDSMLYINSSNTGIPSLRIVNDYIARNSIILSNIEKPSFKYSDIPNLNATLEINYTNISDNLQIDYTSTKITINSNYEFYDSNSKELSEVIYNVSNLNLERTEIYDNHIRFDFFMNESYPTHRINTSNTKDVELFYTFENEPHILSNTYRLPQNLYVSNIYNSETTDELISDSSQFSSRNIHTYIYDIHDTDGYTCNFSKLFTTIIEGDRTYTIYNTIHIKYGLITDDLSVYWDITLKKDVSIQLLNYNTLSTNISNYTNVDNVDEGINYETIYSIIDNDLNISNIYNSTEINYLMTIYNCNITRKYTYTDSFPKYIDNTVEIININNNTENIPHIILQTNEATNSLIQNYSHSIYNSRGVFKLCIEDNITEQKTLLEIEQSGNTTIHGNLIANNLIINGTITNKTGLNLLDLDNLTNQDVDTTENYTIYTTQMLYLGANLGISINNTLTGHNNTIYIKRIENGNSDLLLLDSHTINNCMIKFKNNTSTNYSLGINDTKFSILNDGVDVFRINTSNIHIQGSLILNNTIISDGVIQKINSNNNSILKINDYNNSNIIDIKTNEIEMKQPLLVIEQWIYSDKTFKTNIKNLIDTLSPLDVIDKLNGVTYYNLLSKRNDIGLIAQDVEKVLPEVVYKDTNNKYSLAYANIVALLIEGIKELKKEVHLLKLKNGSE